MNKQIKITKDVEGELFEGECLPEALPVWVAHGWTAVEDGSSGESSDGPHTAKYVPAIKVPADPAENKE